jgi:hypothetical protein
MVVWKMPTFLMSRRLTVEHSYSKKMLESGDNQIKKKKDRTQQSHTANATGWARTHPSETM